MLHSDLFYLEQDYTFTSCHECSHRPNLQVSLSAMLKTDAGRTERVMVT